MSGEVDSSSKAIFGLQHVSSVVGSRPGCSMQRRVRRPATTRLLMFSSPTSGPTSHSRDVSQRKTSNCQGSLTRRILRELRRRGLSANKGGAVTLIIRLIGMAIDLITRQPFKLIEHSTWNLPPAVPAIPIQTLHLRSPQSSRVIGPNENAFAVT